MERPLKDRETTQVIKAHNSMLCLDPFAAQAGTCFIQPEYVPPPCHLLSGSGTASAAKVRSFAQVVQS